LGKFNTGRRQPSEAKAVSLGGTTIISEYLIFKGFCFYPISYESGVNDEVKKSNQRNDINKANKFGKSRKKKIQVYANAITEIENFYQNQILPSLYKNDKTINLSTNVFYLLKDSYTIVNGISNMKTEKTMALIELLDHTRLLSPGELVKQGK